jgi:exonuclease VII small subunit
MSNKDAFKLIRAFMDETEEFYSDVSDLAEKNLKDKEIKLYPEKVKKPYKSDLIKCHKIYGKFLDVSDRIDPESPDMKIVRKASEERGKLALICEKLDAQNAMFSAYIGARVATQYVGVITLLAIVVKNGEGELARVTKKVEKLTSDLKKVKSLVRGAKAQRTINVTISVATTVLLPELRVVQAVYAAMAIGLTRTAIDDMLGPTGATTAGGIKNVSTEYAGCATTLGNTVNSAASVISSIDTLISDGVEVNTAEKLLKTAKKDLQDAQKRLVKLKLYAKPNGTQLRKLAIGLDKAQKEASSKVRAYKTAKSKRDELQKDLANAQSAG